jgi:hypothetical protein
MASFDLMDFELAGEVGGAIVFLRTSKNHENRVVISQMLVIAILAHPFSPGLS